MWREEWASGRIRCSGRSTFLLSWFFALFWNAVSLPLLWAIPAEVEKGNQAALIGVLFPLVGVGLVVWAIRTTIHRFRFGSSEFQMDTLPGVIGGELRGTVHAKEGVSPLDGFRVKLVCVNRVTTGSGQSRTISEHIRWQEEQTVGAGRVISMPYRTDIPVVFRIPYEVEPSSPESSDNEIVWRLEVQAAVPGVDFKARFVLPVFKTDESSPEASSEIREAPLEPAQLEERSGVRIRPSPTGGQEILFPPARNLGVAVGVTLFTAVWSAIVVGLAYAGELLFFVVFGFFELLLLYAVMALWLQRTRVRVEYGRIEIRDRILGIGRTVTLDSSDVDSIRPEIRMQSGSTPYYDVRITRRSGSPVSAGRWIRSRRDAEAIAQALRSAVGLPAALPYL